MADADQPQTHQATLFGGPPAMPVPASQEARNILRKIREHHNRAERTIERYFERETCPKLSLGPKDPRSP